MRPLFLLCARHPQNASSTQSQLLQGSVAWEIEVNTRLWEPALPAIRPLATTQIQLSAWKKLHTQNQAFSAVMNVSHVYGFSDQHLPENLHAIPHCYPQGP